MSDDPGGQSVPPARRLIPAGALPARRFGWRGELWAFLELLAMCGFVVVQPLLDALGGSPDFFIFHSVTGGEVMLVVTLLTLVPPLVLWGVGVLSGLAGAAVRLWVHLASIGLLLVVLMIYAGKLATSMRGIVLTVLAVLLAAVIVMGYLRFDWVRQLFRFAAVGPLVFVLLFTFASPSSTVFLAAGQPATGDAPLVSGSHPPVVMIVFDEFPLVSLLDGDGGIDAARFPHFARLAADSTWYRNATSVASWTPQAMPAMMTGRYPIGNVAGHYAVFPDNLFTLLAQTHEVKAVETVTRLCPPRTCRGQDDLANSGIGTLVRASTSLFGEIASPFDSRRDPTTSLAEPTLAELGSARAAVEEGPEFLFDRARSENRPARFEHYLGSLVESTGSAVPTLDLLHVLIPHSPWTYLPSGFRYDAPHLPIDGQWWAQLARERHLLQVGYTDRLLGEILQVLEQSDRYDESLIVVTSDHGHSFTPGSAGRNVDDTLRGLTELAWVPLFIKAPGQTEGVVDDRNWQQVDLLPTIADHVGVEVPWEVDGRSALSGERVSSEKVFYDSSDLDNPVTFDGSPHLRRLLGNADPVPPLPPLPRPDLLGATPPVSAAQVEVDLDNPAAYLDVRLDQRVVPALVLGTVAQPLPEGTLLAVTVNGRVGAVAPVVTVDGVPRVAALVPDEDLFVAGTNDVAFYPVSSVEG